VTSRDASANAATDPPINSPAAQFQTSAAPCAVDRVAADFSAGQLAGTYVSLTDDGEVILAPALGAEFDVMPPTSEWQSFPWQGGGASSLASGSLLVDGARFNSEPEAGYAPERSLEFVATFAAVPFQHVGFGGGGDNEPNAEFDTSPWAIFSTGTSGSSLMARAWNGGPFLDTQLPAVTLGLPHRFRIDWLSARVDFYVDGTLAHSEPVSITGPMRPAASDFAVGGGGVSVDWMRLSPYSANGTFESRVFDAASPATWGAATWSADVPAGTSLSIEARVGDTSTPDESWTPYAPLASSGSSVGLTARYLQYRLNLATGDPTLTPALRDLQVECSLPLAAVQHVALPAVTMARPAMPNPSSGRTTIAYVIGTDAAAQGQTAVSLTVYDMSGRAVRSLVRGPQSAGNYRAVWDATDDQGRGVRPGVYYFSLRAGRIRHQGKMVLLH
jgi:hypothetical protein